MTKESIAGSSVVDVKTVSQEVLKTAFVHHGIHESVKALNRHPAHLCVLSSNCHQPIYVKLVEAFCAEYQNNRIKVNDNKKLGKWVDLCKTDRDGKPHKVFGCSCLVVKDYDEESQANDVIEEYFKYKK
ncbi:40S ribosomal protein S12-like [Sorex araneus]|uniref:40S ribosomal protein S12-like n=1 Tax=Sorex araneus TaxID=42254 RepID=UPI002433CD63|nr:40S ribosomal protein S12-like [Sorex araneus]